MRFALFAAAACASLAACGSSSGTPAADASAPDAPTSTMDASHPADAGTPDALAHDDGPTGPTLPCGAIACNPNTEYCYAASGGPPPPPDASGTSYACKAIPTPCLVNPSCACLAVDGGATCMCSVSGGGYYVTCDFP